LRWWAARLATVEANRNYHPDRQCPLRPSYLASPRALLMRGCEIALRDLRHEAAHATGPSPVCRQHGGRQDRARSRGAAAPQKMCHRGLRRGRRSCSRGDGLPMRAHWGGHDVVQLEGGLQGVEERVRLFPGCEFIRQGRLANWSSSAGNTPSLPADEVARLMTRSQYLFLDVRGSTNYATMNLPGSGQRARRRICAPRSLGRRTDPDTNAHRQLRRPNRSIIGASRLITPGQSPQGGGAEKRTIGWDACKTRARHGATGRRRRPVRGERNEKPMPATLLFRAGVSPCRTEEAIALQAQTHRTTYA